MLTAHQLHVAGRHHTLLPATTALAQRGELLLIQADGQERRTALALTLTGRMKPSSGSVVLGHDSSMAALRRRSALVDSPDVNAPEHHLTTRSLTSEDLALVPLRFRDRTRPTAWLVNHGFRDILDQWIEELEPHRLLHLQLELALANRDVELLVIDSPDRHTADVSAWLPLLEAAAAGELGRGPDAHTDSPPRPLLVIGVVARLPDEWDGPSTIAGNAASQELFEHSTTKHDADQPPAAATDAAASDAAGDPAAETTTGALPEAAAEPSGVEHPDTEELRKAPLATASETEITTEEKP
ncbi:ABC transporter ATP-binding protein [Arthrobacter sp. Sr24]